MGSVLDDGDVAFAETPTGGKAHVVDFDRQSMLARGTRNASNYASACGQVPDTWDRLASPPDDPTDVCRRCAKAALDDYYASRLDAVQQEIIVDALGDADV